MGLPQGSSTLTPTHARRPSKMVITKRRAELKYKPPDPRYPHPSQASVDHPGPSSTASTTWSQPSSANCKTVATLKRSRQCHPQNTSGPVATPISTHPTLLPNCPPALRPLSLALREGGNIDVLPGIECSLASVCGQYTALE